MGSVVEDETGEAGPMVPLPDRLAWTVVEFASLTSLSPQTVRRCIERGELTCRRIGTRQIIPRDAGLAFLGMAS
jgi:excisionase family DNA binding protein